MRVYVAGSFSEPRSVKKALGLQAVLRRAGFEVLNQLEFLDYTQVKDFRDEIDLGKSVLEHDLSLLREADVIFALADEPSFGTGAEVFYAKRILGKKVVALATEPAKSPWIVTHADKILKRYSIPEVIEALKTFSDFI